MKARHTKGPWTAKRWDTINFAIYPHKRKNGMIVALAQMPGVGGPVSDEERAANIRLIEEAPRMFDVLCKAHDLLLDGHHEEARSWIRDAIDAVVQERFPDTY